MKEWSLASIYAIGGLLALITGSFLGVVTSMTLYFIFA